MKILESILMIALAVLIECVGFHTRTYPAFGGESMLAIAMVSFAIVRLTGKEKEWTK